jgi:hypothetical protein
MGGTAFPRSVNILSRIRHRDAPLFVFCSYFTTKEARELLKAGGLFGDLVAGAGNQFCRTPVLARLQMS